MSTLHSGWHNERISLLGTLGTPQFVVLGLGLLPALFFLQAQAWILFAVALLSWLLLFAVVALPIRERPAWLWIADGLMHMIGKSTRTAKAPAGKRARKVKQYKNPHTGEVIETKGGNHKTLKEWKAKWGPEAVESWATLLG